MKITMIGTSGSGKTTFSAAVYQRMMKRSFELFKVVPRAENFSQEVIDTHKFADDYRILGNKGWPPGTTDTSYYKLNLLYDGRQITYFDWIDYRGGFLDNPTIDPLKAEEVHANIAASDAVILFADSQKLTEYADTDEASFKSGADCIIQILDGYARSFPNNNLSFIIALTKCDAVAAQWKGANNDYTPLVRRGTEVFEPLRETFRRERQWRGGIIPVSALGEGNVDQTGQIIGFPKPYNVENVMAFCVGSTLRFDREDLVTRIIERDGDKQSIEAKYKGTWGTIVKTFKMLRGTYTDGNLLEEIRNEQRNDYVQLQTIKGAIQPLENIALRQIRIIT